MPKVKINSEFLQSILNPESNSTTTTQSASPTQPSARTKTQSTTLYETLYTENGFHNLKKWFLNNKLENNLTEVQFIKIMKKLTNFREYKILEIFDLLDFEDAGRLNFAEFFLIVSLYAADLSGQCKNFLYRNGRQLFEILSANKPPIDPSRFLLAGCILGYSEYEVDTFLKKNEMTIAPSLTFDVIAFVLVEALDQKSGMHCLFVYLISTEQLSDPCVIQ